VRNHSVVSVVLSALALVPACKGREAPASAAPAPQRPVAPAPQRPAPAPAPVPEGALAAVTRFDCGSSLPTKQLETLRGFRGAGPAGSAFNWDQGDLACELTMYVGCRASGVLRVDVGHVARPPEEFGLTEPGELKARVTLPVALWTAQLEEQAGLPYKTLQLSARVDGACAGGDAGLRSFHAIDAFIAGFASGE
jgi:hypothetical protein